MVQLSPARPEILGLHGMVASTHWLATAAGMAMLERGGTAADAAAATGFVLQVVEPHMCGPGGDLPAIVSEPGGGVHVLCGQGPVPRAATIEEYRRRGLDLVPGQGLLAAVVPGAFGGWLLLLERWGRLPLSEVLTPALDLCEHGFPISPGVAGSLDALSGYLQGEWPSSARTWLHPDGTAPKAGERWRLPGLAATWRAVSDIADSTPTREAGIEAARRFFYEGAVATAIDAFSRQHDGLLGGDDLVSWRATVEDPVTLRHAGWTVHKTQSWGQGPVMLQQLALLAALGDLPPSDTAEHVHLVTEVSKLAFADREAWYGDPDAVDVPVPTLLSDAYARDRAALIDEEQASDELRPGSPDGRAPHLPSYGLFPGSGRSDPLDPDHRIDPARSHAPGADVTTGEPSRREAVGRGDTVHLDTVDRDGLMISATPSGGWLQSSPTIPALGFCLGSRAQMTWLDERSASALRPGRRPRTTLTPSLAVHEDGRRLGWGTPGGDQQDQWSLSFFLRVALEGMGLQQAIDAPAFHNDHMPSSFWPRLARPGYLAIEKRYGTDVLDDLRRRGHAVDPMPSWSLGRLSAVADDRPVGGWLRAGANPRGGLGYAAGR
ncbi:MAG TPA: gamma-glutamyltransferase [Mycobacteriales bacterium]|nr:gamma-glutamyltransferase [Mycobacteriales bacterium]